LAETGPFWGMQCDFSREARVQPQSGVGFGLAKAATTPSIVIFVFAAVDA